MKIVPIRTTKTRFYIESSSPMTVEEFVSELLKDNLDDFNQTIWVEQSALHFNDKFTVEIYEDRNNPGTYVIADPITGFILYEFER